MNWGRTILHLDMDAFFAAVEQRDDPSLRGKPLLIGHDGPRGVVATASYEARPYGCHSAQPMAVARRLCPHAVILPVRGRRYREVSRQMFAILADFSPVIEPLSIDEAFLDLSGSERLLGAPEEIAQTLKSRIRSELGLTGSIGLAPNKFLAKLGSDMNKPDGVMIIHPEDVNRVLSPLPVSKLWGVGSVTAAKLADLNVRTIAQMRQLPREWVDRFFGSDGQRYFDLAHGRDDRPVVCDREAKSIGHEQTFEVDVADAVEVRRVLLDQAEQVGYRLRRSGLWASGLSLKIRFGHFQTISRSTTLRHPTNSTGELWEAAQQVFERWSFQPVRLIGVTVERLSREAQGSLFADAGGDRQRKLDAVTDRINEKFGKRFIRRGG